MSKSIHTLIIGLSRGAVEARAAHCLNMFCEDPREKQIPF